MGRQIKLISLHIFERSKYFIQFNKAATGDDLKNGFSQKQVFRNLPGENSIQNPWKVLMKKFIFIKVAGLKAPVLIKMIYFIDTVQGLRLNVGEHLFFRAGFQKVFLKSPEIMFICIIWIFSRRHYTIKSLTRNFSRKKIMASCIKKSKKYTSIQNNGKMILICGALFSFSSILSAQVSL